MLRIRAGITNRDNQMLNLSDFFNARILIVDDQESNNMLLELVLVEAGYKRIDTTKDATKVCPLHRLNRYDLILLDLQLPHSDGFQVMESLKTNTDDPYLPVIVLTAQPDPKLRALQAGAKDFISKPFDLVEIKTRIKNVLEVRLLYKKLEEYNQRLELVIEERTAELRESEARFRSLTDLAADWYWEQDERGKFTKVSGPVPEMLGIKVNSHQGKDTPELSGWDDEQRTALHSKIAARKPFLDFMLGRHNEDGGHQAFRISGQPMFNEIGVFVGYRGIGVEVL
jgi:PAS domain S-box-containing protein